MLYYDMIFINCQCVHIMSTQERKGKLDFDSYAFKAQWSAGYRIIELDVKDGVYYVMTLS